MGFPLADKPAVQAGAKPRSARRDWIEIAVGYALILLALWIPRPAQRYCDWAALVWVVVATAVSFDGWTAMGFTHRGFLRSLWIPGAALVLACIAVALSWRFGALHGPGGAGQLDQWVQRFWGYSIWALLQEFLILDFFLLRLLRRLPGRAVAVLVTALLFTSAHIPNPVLMPLVLVWGVIACVLFLRYRNLYTVGLAHAILGVCIAVSVPSRMDHNMRVGLGYVTYHAPRHTQQFIRDQPWLRNQDLVYPKDNAEG